MRSRTLGGVCLAALISICAPAAALAQSPTATQVLTSADQGIVDDFLAAANGDAGVRDAFVARRVAAEAFMPKAAFSDLLGAMARTGAPMKLQSAARKGGRLRLILTAANGKTARVDLDLSPAEPGRLAGILPVPMPAPYAGAPVDRAVSRSDLAAAIDRRVRFSADRDDFSGAVLVVKGDQVIYSAAFGEADKAAHKPATLDTRFNLGSMDKQFTAVAIGQLIEQGKLTLDTRLIDVLPDYPNPEAARKITIRHLLSHSAGLGMLFDRPGWDWKLKYQRMDELFPLFAKAPLEFEPGAQGSYANEGFVVLGAVVEKVSGMSWYDYVQRNVFDRAGMSRTGYLTDDPTVPDRATGYKFGEDDPLGLGARRPNWDNLSARGNSCGGGFSTAGDLIKFLQALRSGRLLKPETVALFTAQAGGEKEYGFGFEHIPMRNGRTLVGHGGGGPGSGINSDAKMVWETGYAYAVVGNYDAPFAQNLSRDIGQMLAAQDRAQE